MVLTIHVVRQGGHQYYVQDLVPGRAEGGRVAGEESGVWLGPGAVSLGLSGPVTSSSFAEVLEGRDPASGRTLRTGRGERSVAGYDLTFCAPKSVSVLHLLAPGEIADAAGTGHRRAVADALDYLGREGIGVRRSRHGHVSFLPTTGPVAGEFLHRTSRALDPHLHTHVVVANVAEGVDGMWSGVDSRRLFAHLGTAQALYHARLRLELGDRMGAAWELHPSGLADVVGVDPGLCRLFSQRSASMDEYRQRTGIEARASGSAAAFHVDRPDKDRCVTVDALVSGWKQRAADLGFDLGELTRSVGVHRRPGHLVVDRGLLRRQLLGMTGALRSIGHHQLVAALASSTAGGAASRDVELAATGLMEAYGATPRAAGSAGPGRSATGPHWDPTDVIGMVDGLVSDRAWPDHRGAPAGHPASALVTAAARALVRFPEQATEPSNVAVIRTGGPAHRPPGLRHEVRAPSSGTHALDIGR